MMRRFVIFLLLLALLNGCSQDDALVQSMPSSRTVYLAPTSTSIPKIQDPYTTTEVITAENLDEMQLLTQLGIGHIVTVELSPDNQLLAVYTGSGIYVYDTASLSLQGFLETPWNPTGVIAFSPDSNLILFRSISYLSNFYGAWNLTTGEIESAFSSKIADWKVTDLSFTPDGENIAAITSGSYAPCDSAGSNFALYNLERELLFDEYYCDVYGKAIYYVDGEQLVLFIDSTGYSASDEPYAIYVIDRETGDVLASFTDTYEGDERLITPIMMGRTWEWARENTDETPMISERCNMPDDHAVNSYEEIYVDGEHGIYTVNHLDTIARIELWDLVRCQIMQELSYPAANELLFSSDGTLLAVNDGFNSCFLEFSGEMYFGFNVYVWDMKSQEIRFVVEGKPFESPVDVFTFNADGTRLITSSHGKDYWHPQQPYHMYSLMVWDTATGENVLEIESSDEFLRRMMPTSDPDIILVYDDKGFNLWNIKNGNFIAKLPYGLFALDAKRNGVWIAIQNEGTMEKIALFDVQTGDMLQELDYTGGRIRGLYVDGDGETMQIAMFIDSQGLFIEVDLNTGEELWQQKMSHYSDDGAITYSIKNHIDDSYDKYLGTHRRGFHVLPLNEENPIPTFPGFLRWANEDMVISEQEGRYQFWDAVNGRFLHEMQPSFRTEDLHLSPDKHFLAVSGSDGIIRIFGVPVEEE